MDFACKEFQVEDVIKCALNLTNADLKVMKYFLKETDQWLTLTFFQKFDSGHIHNPTFRKKIASKRNFTKDPA